MKFSPFYYVGILTLILLAGLMAMIFYLFVLPMKTIVYHNLPFPVEQKIYHPNEVVPITIDMTKYTDASFLVAGSMVGDVYTYDLGTRNRVIPPGHNHFTSLIWQVPPDAKPGAYTMIFEATVKINSFRDDTIRSYTERFIVTK